MKIKFEGRECFRREQLSGASTFLERALFLGEHFSGASNFLERAPLWGEHLSERAPFWVSLASTFLLLAPFWVKHLFGAGTFLGRAPFWSQNLVRARTIQGRASFGSEHPLDSAHPSRARALMARAPQSSLMLIRGGGGGIRAYRFRASLIPHVRFSGRKCGSRGSRPKREGTTETES